MLRYLHWRLRFELCNLKRLLGTGERTVDYLAFGANLSDDILRERCMAPLAARPFTLRDHGLRFDHPAPWADCGYASAEPAPGESLYGYVYTLWERDAARMDFYEVVPVLGRYRRSVVEQDGETVFFYRTNRSTPRLRPTAEYLGYIVEGLQSHPDVAAEYLEWLRAIEPAEPGAMVSNYHCGRRIAGTGPFATLRDAYQRLTLKCFLALLYRYSPTEWLIRLRERPGRD